MGKNIPAPDWLQLKPMCPSAGYPDRPYLTCELERGHEGNHRAVVVWENDDE